MDNVSQFVVIFGRFQMDSLKLMFWLISNWVNGQCQPIFGDFWKILNEQIEVDI